MAATVGVRHLQWWHTRLPVVAAPGGPAATRAGGGAGLSLRGGSFLCVSEKVSDFYTPSLSLSTLRPMSPAVVVERQPPGGGGGFCGGGDCERERGRVKKVVLCVPSPPSIHPIHPITTSFPFPYPHFARLNTSSKSTRAASSRAALRTISSVAVLTATDDSGVSSLARDARADRRRRRL